MSSFVCLFSFVRLTGLGDWDSSPWLSHTKDSKKNKKKNWSPSTKVTNFTYLHITNLMEYFMTDVPPKIHKDPYIIALKCSN